MKKVLRLVSVQIWAMLAGMVSVGDYKKKKTKALFSGFIAFTVIIIAASFAYAYLTGSGLMAFNSVEILPSMFMSVTSIVVLFTTIYKVKGTVFGFKDYDLVMSMPVSNGKIVASRLLLLYFINLYFVLIIMLPMAAAYGMLARPGFIFYLFSILTVFFIPLIPIIIASLLGTVFAFISGRLRYSNILYIVLIFAVLVTWIIIPGFLGDSEEAMVDISKVISGRIDKIYPMATLYSRAVTQGNVLALVIFLTVSVLAFLVYSWVVGKVFIKINTEIMTGRHKADYRMGELKSSSPLMALYKREFKRYFASPVYVLNTGFGMVILLLFAIAMPFIDLDRMLGDMQITGTIGKYLPPIIMFCMGTSCTTMASVSIEGKNLWIVKSLPVPASTVFASKILVNLSVLSPAVLASVLMGIILKIPFINGLLTVFTVISFALFISAFGLAVNLSFPNLTWSNETVIVKQSAASSITVLSCTCISALQLGLTTVIRNFRLSIFISLCLIWLLNVLLYKRLAGKGARQFEEL